MYMSMYIYIHIYPLIYINTNKNYINPWITNKLKNAIKKKSLILTVYANSDVEMTKLFQIYMDKLKY